MKDRFSDQLKEALLDLVSVFNSSVDLVTQLDALYHKTPLRCFLLRRRIKAAKNLAQEMMVQATNTTKGLTILLNEMEDH